MEEQRTVIIKNMVCPRCIDAVQQIFEAEGFHPLEIQLGRVRLSQTIHAAQKASLISALQQKGFELLDDRQTQLINKIKSIIIQQVHYEEHPSPVNLSSLLKEQLHYDYSYLSRLFSAVEGQTIERYVMAQKVEKVKELLTYGELTLSEIAFQLHYSSAAHLSTQFKKMTGMTPSAFKRLQNQARKSLDQL